MKKSSNGTQPKGRYRAKVTGRHAITLPADLCRMLGIEVGDVVDLIVIGQSATLNRAGAEEHPPARGLLRGYFSDWESVNRYVVEERRGWQERDVELMDSLNHQQPPTSMLPE